MRISRVSTGHQPSGKLHINCIYPQRRLQVRDAPLAFRRGAPLLPEDVPQRRSGEPAKGALHRVQASPGHSTRRREQHQDASHTAGDALRQVPRFLQQRRVLQGRGWL